MCVGFYRAFEAFGSLMHFLPFSLQDKFLGFPIFGDTYTQDLHNTPQAGGSF